MKKGFYYIGAVIASLVAGTASAYADCPNGRCYDRENVFTDIMNFSRNSQCPTLSSQQALRIASAASHDQLDPEGFKNAYQSSCDYEVSFSAARNGYTAEIFTGILDYTKNSSCPTLRNDQALEVANIASSRQLNPEGFKTAYKSSCDYNVSLRAARSERKANIFKNILDDSKNSSCPTLRNDQALEVADAAVSEHLSPQGFETAYRSSCNYQDSLHAASHRREAEVYQEILDSSKRSSCPTLRSDQALAVAEAADTGRVNAQDFELAYNSSCNFQDSFSAAACQNLGSLLQGSSDKEQRLASARESGGSSKAELIPLAMDFAPEKSMGMSTSSARAD